MYALPAEADGLYGKVAMLLCYVAEVAAASADKGVVLQRALSEPATSRLTDHDGNIIFFSFFLSGGGGQVRLELHRPERKHRLHG